jgi:hypothetical protein
VAELVEDTSEIQKGSRLVKWREHQWDLWDWKVRCVSALKLHQQIANPGEAARMGSG